MDLIGLLADIASLPASGVGSDAVRARIVERVVAVALEHAALTSSVAARAERDRMRLEVAQLAARSTDLEAVVTGFAAAFARIAGATAVTIALPHPDAPMEQFVHRATFGLTDAERAAVQGVPVRREVAIVAPAFERDAVQFWHVSDLQIEPVRRFFEGRGDLYHATVPLIAHGQVVGVSFLCRRTPFDAESVAALEAIRHELALALRSASERDEALRIAEREAVVASLRALVGKALALPDVLSGIVERLGRAFGASRCFIALTETATATEAVICHEHVAPGLSPLGPLRLAVPPGLRLVACVDVTRDPQRVARLPALPGARALVFVPIEEAGERRGALFVVNEGGPRTWREADVLLARAAAEHAAIAIARAAVDEAARRRAVEHELTIAQMTDGIAIFDEHLRVQRVNAAALEICWLSKDMAAEEVRVDSDVFSVHELDGRALAVEEFPIVRAVTRGEVTRAREFLVRRRADGAERRVVADAQPLRDAAGRLVGGVLSLRDVTAERAAAANAARTENLRVVGELAASVAHEVNNALAAVLGRAGLLARSTAEPETRRGLDVIAQAARDASETLGRLTRLSRRASGGVRRPIDLRSPARDAIELTRPRWSRAGETPRAIEVLLDAGPPLVVLGVASELREVFTNVVLNALDAGARHVRVSLRTDLDAGLAVAEVTDDGAGMSDDVKRHAFEPFFTTKGEAGTGLGLPISSAITEAHGGRLELRSRAGEGTTVKVVLPLAPAADALAPRELEAGVDVLVVDDDPRVRAVLVANLVEDGHRVVSFASGEEAIAHVDSGHRPRLVVSDLLMPGMPGWVLAEEVHARAPDAAIVFVSGWPGSAPLELVEKLGATVLPKPFDADAVRAACIEALRRRATPRV